MPEFAAEEGEAEDSDEVDETYEQWAQTSDDSDETEDLFEADHGTELEPLEISAELAPDEERFLGGGEIDETSAETRGGDVRTGRAEFEEREPKYEDFEPF